MLAAIEKKIGDLRMLSLIIPKPAYILLIAASLVALPVISSKAADSFSEVDRAFVAKVSQGGMYEVALGKVAETQARAQDIKDSGTTEANDHMLVGEKLKAIIEANGMSFPTRLNPEFQARLDRISSLPPDKFDAAYIHDMKKIHDADGAAFAKEAANGSNPDLRAFAAETYRIVQRHLGELGAKVE
jgi:putative membrane protein